MNDLLFVQGKDNLAGLVGEIYICPTEDILTVPALGAAAVPVTAAADIVCKTGKKFSRLYITDETGKVESKPIGERDGIGSETIITGRYPKIGAALAAFKRQSQNTPVVIIFRGADGKLYLLGVTQLDITSTVLSLTIPAYFLNGDSSTGEKRSDQNGAMLGWKFSCAHDPIEYAGAVPLVAAP
jgi:hypothetical protein